MANKRNLLSAIMMMHMLAGETYHQGGGHHVVEGIQIVWGKKSVGGWVWPGMPLRGMVDLSG